MDDRPVLRDLGDEAISKIRSLAADSPAEALAIARAEARLHPRNEKLVLMRARLERRNENFSEAFSTYNAVRRASGAITPETAKVLFEVLVRRHRFRVARKLYDYAAARGLAEEFFYALVAEMALYDQDVELCSRILAAQSDSVKRTSRYQQYKTVVECLQDEREQPHDSMAGVRHIAIGGVSFVGSTIFGIILGSLPGLTFASETHWLYETGALLPDGRRATIDNTGAPEKQWPVACRVCGRRCNVFDKEFRLQLAGLRAGRYAAIARRLETDTLITADKNFTIFWLEDPLFRFDLILLYKPLRSQVWSALKNHARLGGNVEGTEGEAYVEAWLERWMRLYGMMLGFARPRGKRVVLNWDEFSIAPMPHLARLVDILGLPPADGVLENISVKHLIGGNAGVNVHELVKTRRVQLRAPEQPRLSENIERLIAGNKEAARLERSLERYYSSDFGPAHLRQR